MPVTTRRSKRRASQTVNSKPAVDPDDSDQSNTGDPGENTSDWEEARGEGSNASRRKKRARRTTVLGFSKVNRRGIRNRAGATIFPTLPLDIIFEILSLLTPLELANLAQTNQAFHATITSPQASKIWKIARKAVWNVPDCPPKVSESAWARLIYGGAKCQVCGTPNVHKIDFAIMRRACVKCKKKKFVYAGFFAKRYPDFDVGILELLPYTDTGGWSHGHSHSRSRFYWEDDIYAIAKIYGQLQGDIYSRIPGASERMQKFRDERAEYVHTVLAHAKECQKWWDNFETNRDQDNRSQIQRRYDEICRRFRELGYLDQDIRAIQRHNESYRTRDVTERVWNRIRPILEPLIDVARCKRVEMGQTYALDVRKLLVNVAYDNYKRTLRPIEWIHLPPTKFIYATPVFRSLVYANFHTPLQQAACNEAAIRLPEYIASYRESLNACLLQSMAGMGVFGRVNEQARLLPIDQGNDQLSLASSVFSSHRYMCLSSADALAHLAYDGSPAQHHQHGTTHWIDLYENLKRAFSYNSRGASVVKAMIAELGLDPMTVRCEDLDRLDRRFICQLCRRREAPQSRDRAYSWRTGVTHFLENMSHYLPLQILSQSNWKALNEDESAAVRRAEGADPAWQQEMWSCNHCTIHLNNLQTYPMVLDHVKKTHALDTPEENVDLFHLYPSARQRPDPLLFPLRLTSPEDAEELIEELI
ncbi:uncharacterized protein B0H18DRAFT_498915 [Fomitopsis serialis]|uniref:uncharacterized protein n=1 Tax=Fomitopsis serialis TaxID=139415 RepID=UPI002008B17A|nr:uncharacterized protein B0H18DRAFT_498915 [Neoantrodia serialis]KAH9922967.1 hypothetical protein B0H18DRAFT_498915 [Neoantrodia serialis]